MGPYVARGPVGSYGMLSPCDSDSDPDQPVADGPVGPYVARGPINPCGTLSPCDFETAGPVGLCGTLSPSEATAVGPGGPDGPLSSSDLTGILFSAVPAGIPFSVGPVGPVGLCGTWSPSDSESAILVDPGGMLPSSDLAGILFRAAPAGIPFSVGPVGPVGPCGTRSPSDSESVILVDPGAVFPSSDLARMRGPAAPAESAFLMGPVGPAMSLGVLPLSDSESADPVVPTMMQSSSIVELVGPLGPVVTLLPGEVGPGLCPVGMTIGLWPVVAVPLLAVRDPMIALSPVERLERDCAEVEEEYITVYGDWSGPDVAKTPAVVAMVDMDTLMMGHDAPLDYVDGSPAWNSGYQREIITGMTVCCGGDLCDSDESDWDDPSDIANADDPQTMVVFNDKLFSDDVLADTSVSLREEVPVLALQTVTDKGAPLVTPVVRQDIRRIKDELFSHDERTDEVSVCSLPMGDLLIHRGALDMGLSHGGTRWFCLLSSAGGWSGRPVPGSLERNRLGPWYRGSTMHTRVF